MTLPRHDAVAADGSLDVLRGLIAETPKNGAGLYWLLDQSALPQHGWLASQIGKARWIDLLGGESEGRFNGASPIIVSLAGQSERANLQLAEQLYRAGRFANAIGLISSPLAHAELQATLCKRARIDLPGKFEAVLRYFDTRTLPLLPRLLSPSQYASFIGNIPRWTYIDRWGVIQTLPPAAVSDAPAPTRLELDDAQEAMLIDDGLTDAVIDLLLTQQHRAVQELSPPAQFDLIDPWVDGARTAGLCEPFEALGFVDKALFEGTAFSQSESWRGRLNDYLQKRCSIEEVFA